MSQSSGTDVAYALPMLGGRIDRDAWAREIEALVVRFDPGPQGKGNKSAFARRIGMTRRTLERWAARANDVDLDSVAAVLDRLHLPDRERTELLTRIGFIITERPTPSDPRDDEVIRQIMADPRWTDAERADLVEEQLARIKADLRRRQEEYDRLRKMRPTREAS